jgi:hypothetical protein
MFTNIHKACVCIVHGHVSKFDIVRLSYCEPSSGNTRGWGLSLSADGRCRTGPGIRCRFSPAQSVLPALFGSGYSVYLPQEVVSWLLRQKLKSCKEYAAHPKARIISPYSSRCRFPGDICCLALITYILPLL